MTLTRLGNTGSRKTRQTIFAPAYRCSYGVVIDFRELSKESVREIESRWSDITEPINRAVDRNNPIRYSTRG